MVSIAQFNVASYPDSSRTAYRCTTSQQGQLGRRTGVVVLAPVPGRRCDLYNAGAGQSSGGAATAGPDDRRLGAKGGQM
jgi:hypothetical protein